MTRRAVALFVLAMAQVVVGSGRAAVPAADDPQAALPSDPVLAIAAIDRNIAGLSVQEQADRKELAGVGEQLASRHARVLARGRAFYRMTRAGLLPVGGGFGALVTYAIHVERARRMLASEIDAETRLRGRGADLARDLERLARDRVTFGSQRAAMDAARVAAQDEHRRQLAFARAFQTSTGPGAAGAAGGGYMAVYGGTELPPDTPAGGFATARGRLLFPIAGRAEVTPARRAGTEGAGLEIRAPAGAPVRAVFAGRVAFADRYGPYGRIVILDHGDHYYTVSGNLNEIDVRIGQDVPAGDRIGTVGDDGRGSMLYFEVRHGSRTMAPEPWLGL
jgi:murein DD-endopeptidase MepM/ murein hydrolase activator NlpD